MKVSGMPYGVRDDAERCSGIRHATTENRRSKGTTTSKNRDHLPEIDRRRDSMPQVRKHLVRAVLFLSAAGICLSTGQTPAAPAAPPLVVTPNEFYGTDVERINRAIEAAVAAGCRVVIPRVNVRAGQRREVWPIDMVQYGSSGKAVTVAAGPESVWDFTSTNVRSIKN